MAINLESIRRAYRARYGADGDVSRQIAIEYLQQVPGAIQELRKEEDAKVQKYFEDAPDLEPFKGYNASEKQAVLKWSEMWKESAAILAKRNVSEEDKLFHTERQDKIEAALKQFKLETDFYIGKRNEIIDVGNNLHPITTDKQRILYNRFITNEYRENRVVDFNTGKSKWGQRVEEVMNEEGNFVQSFTYDFEDIYTFKNPIASASQSDINKYQSNEVKIMNLTNSLADGDLSREVSEERIRSLVTTLYSDRGVWTSEYMDNFVQNVYADMFDAGFGETELGKQLSSADNAQFFKNFNQIEGEQEKLDYLKDTLKTVNIKNSWIDFNTNVRMKAWDETRQRKQEEPVDDKDQKVPSELIVAREKDKATKQNIQNQLNALDEDINQPSVDLGNGFTVYRYQGGFVVLGTKKPFIYNSENPPPAEALFSSTNAIRKKYGVEVKLP